MDIKKTLVVSHPGYHGFFSYCSVALKQIIKYFFENKSLPDYVDMRKIFTMFKGDESIDISSIFFKSNMYVDKIYFTTEISYFTNDLQFTNYHQINYDIIAPFIKKYFYISDEINNIIFNIENKYNIDYKNTCCIFYRGNDKNTETIIPSYEEVYSKVNNKMINEGNITFLLQSDETDFFNYFKEKVEKYFIFEDEIKHTRNKKTSINHLVDKDTKLKLVKNFLAIVIIMSRCKYIICTSGNISIWITYFRGNSNNVSHYLIDKWND